MYVSHHERDRRLLPGTAVGRKFTFKTEDLELAPAGGEIGGSQLAD
jgi:hypothetical protein